MRSNLVPRLFLAPLTGLLLVGCEGPAPAGATAQAEDAHPRQEVSLRVRSWSLPAPPGAAQPDLVVTKDGDLLLSWIRPEEDGHVLELARHSAGEWAAATTIARGDDWFVNWADTPHVSATADGALWAHWLQKSAAATYAYDVALVRSSDGGRNWSDPVLVNDDGTPTEHGFVSMWPAASDRIGIAWLDGRETGTAGHGDGNDGGHGGGGAMTVRSAVFDAGLSRSDEAVLDRSACDCCQTDAALTARGPLLVYRDRTEAEIRDIAATRREGGRWSEGRRVHADDWMMPACPVNGPAVAASGEDVVVGWYTAPNGDPQVKLAHSPDAGDSFRVPLLLDSGASVQGRVDVALDAGAAWALWVTEGAEGQALWLARSSTDLSRPLARVRVATQQGRGRATGFPQMVLAGGDVHIVWTEVSGGTAQLRGAVVTAGP